MVVLCALLHSVCVCVCVCVCDSKATSMNMQHILIQELIHYKFKLGNNTMEATKNIFHAKGEGIVDHSTVTR